MSLPPLHQPAFAQRGDELFDVVDAQDQVIGQAQRREVHARQLWHRAVHVLVVGSSSRVFLQKRSLAKDMAPGCWDSSCSGHLDAGEDYAPAARRELGEEIGLRLATGADLTPLFKLPATPDTGWEFVWVYAVRSDGPFQLNPAEIERGDWWTPESLARGFRETPEAFTRPLRFLWPRAETALVALGWWPAPP